MYIKDQTIQMLKVQKNHRSRIINIKINDSI